MYPNVQIPPASNLPSHRQAVRPGWITFTDSGDLLCAEPSIKRALQQWGISLPKNVGPFDRKQVIYLAYHREVIFMG